MYNKLEYIQRISVYQSLYQSIKKVAQKIAETTQPSHPRYHTLVQ